MKIAIAMSGGVDSSVAAKILKDEGHEVVGLFLKLWSAPTSPPLRPHFANASRGFAGLRGASPACKINKENRCCNFEALEDARKVAHGLGIPFYVINARDQFKRAVVDNFIDQYKKLTTPNPCIICNEKIKFDLLLHKALAIGCEKLATGHYARIAQTQNSKLKTQNYVLKTGLDKTKDQSYMLYRLNQDQLSKILFPLGEMTKKEVRALAVKWNLPVKEKPESQEICFIGERDYRDFLRRYLPAKYFKPGEIVDQMGNVIGRHEGLINYTIGQRKGVAQDTRYKIQDTKPLYVVGSDIAKNQLIVGEDGDIYKKEMVVSDLNWIDKKAFSRQLSAVRVKIRYRHEAVPCKISSQCHPEFISGSHGMLKRVQHDNIKVIFDKPQRAVTPGQSAVFYGQSPSRVAPRSPAKHSRSGGEVGAKWDEVLGGGIIQ